MRSNFVNALQSNDTYTDNGMVANSTTGSAVLDLFSKMGGYRKTPDAVVSLFRSAMTEDAQLTLRAMFNNADIRGGQGERDTFKTMFRWLCDNKPDIAKNMIGYVPFYGRWDYVLVALGTEVENDAIRLIKAGLESGNALCAKWMPREHSKTYPNIANRIAEAMGMSPRYYRRTLARLSKTVESQMCANKWDYIDFNGVPSVAAHKLMKAFWKHQPERYGEWVEGLTKVNPDTGKTFSKINAGAIFPHDIIKPYISGGSRVNPVIEAQWYAQKDFVGEGSYFPILDVSGSMTGIPMEVCVSLGIYLAEHNKSAFKNAYMTFSDRPAIRVFNDGDSVYSKVRHAMTGEIANTNLEAAFRLILERAVAARLPQEDMPNSLIIISDMQFDQCVKNRSNSAMNMIDRMYADAGYVRPSIIFWNVDSHENSPAKLNSDGVALVSGFSPSVMQSLFKKMVIKTPYESMLDVLNAERYAQIKL